MNNAQEREHFLQVKSRVGNAIVSPSVLRVAVLLENAKSTYSFNLKKDVGNALVHDVKLDTNDSFVAHKWGISLLCEDPAKPGTGLLLSYPNNTVIPAEAGNVTPAHLNAFYNGKLKFKKDDTVQVEGWPTSLAFTTRTTQQSASGNFSEMFGDDGTRQLPSLITFDGSAKNDVTLEIPAFSGQQVQYVTAPTRLYVVFRAFGFLVTGVSRLNK